MSTFTILDKAECGKRIKRIGSIGAKLQSEIHIVAVSTLAHIRDHGDYTLATALLDALPNGQRVKALAHWFGHFSDGAAVFAFDKNAGAWGCKLLKARTPEMFDIDGAYATSFADLVAEKGYSTLDVKGVLAYLKRKANEDGTNPDGSAKVAEEARTLLSQLFVKAEAITKGGPRPLDEAA
jgi:hypothetical protein